MYNVPWACMHGEIYQFATSIFSARCFFMVFYCGFTCPALYWMIYGLPWIFLGLNCINTLSIVFFFEWADQPTEFCVWKSSASPDFSGVISYFAHTLIKNLRGGTNESRTGKLNYLNVQFYLFIVHLVRWRMGQNGWVHLQWANVLHEAGLCVPPWSRMSLQLLGPSGFAGGGGYG